MSSSLYDNYNYEYYPKTEHYEGDKSFGELKEGDTLYMLERQTDGYKWSELIVTKGWHESKGRCYVSCKRNGKRFIINFGPVNCANVSVDAKRNSIVWDYKGLIGTNKESVYITKKTDITSELERRKFLYEDVLKEMKNYENMWKYLK
jgi:hypothetical protein